MIISPLIRQTIIIAQMISSLLRGKEATDDYFKLTDKRMIAYVASTLKID